MRKLLIWCSGASPNLLKECPETESIRQSILGTFVLLTGILATITSFYTFYSISTNVVWAIPSALLWGVLIFTLDRMIVSSVRVVRNGNVYTLPIYQVVPRLLLSALIGFTIAIPLELYIFRAEIKDQIGVIQEAANRSYLESDIKAQSEASNGLIRDCERKHGPEIGSLRDSLASYDLQIQSTIQGKDGTPKSCGPVCKDLSLKKLVIDENFRAANAIKDLCILKKESDLLKNTIYQQIELDRKAMRARQQANSDSPSLLTQYKTLQVLSDDPAVYRATLFIPLLLIFFEMVPVLAKTLTGVSNYELLAFRQRQAAIDATESAKLESETAIALKKIYEQSNIDLASREKTTVEELHRGVHDQVSAAFLQKIRDRIQLWCQSITEHSEVQKLEEQLSVLFNRRIQSVSDSVSAGMHSNFGDLDSLRSTHKTDQVPNAESSGYRSNDSRTSSRSDVPSSPDVTVTSPPSPQQPPRSADSPMNGAASDTLREYKASFIKKAVESFAGKLPELVGYLFNSSAAFVAGFPAVVLGLASSTSVSLMILFPAVLVAFVIGRAAARNLQRTKPQPTV